MHSKLVSKPGETRVWIAVLEEGEEAKVSLLSLAKTEALRMPASWHWGPLKRR